MTVNRQFIFEKAQKKRKENFSDSNEKLIRGNLEPYRYFSTQKRSCVAHHLRHRDTSKQNEQR